MEGIEKWWGNLTPLTQKLTKTGIAAGAVFGAAQLYNTFKPRPSNPIPFFGNDVDNEALRYLYYDEEMVRALHRIYTLMKKDKATFEKHISFLNKLVRKISKFLILNVETKNIKETNKLLEKIDPMIMQFQNILRYEIMYKETVKEDTELISHALHCHLHNLMMDRFT